MFLALALICIIAAVAWVSRPLWLARLESSQARRSANVAAYRQRLLELDADLAAGLLDARTHATLRAELDARLVVDAGANSESDVKHPRATVLTALLVITIPAVAVLGYAWSGTWRIDQQIAQAADAPAPTQEEIEQLVDALAQRMESQPDQLDGWVLLARSSFSLGRYNAAAEAYRRANELTNGEVPAYLVGEGESLAMMRDRQLSGRPAELFQSALKIEPDHPRALWFAALAAEQAGETDQARVLWQRLSQQDVPPEVRTALQERLAEATPSEPATPASVLTLSVAVSLDPELAADLPGETPVFVFARAAEGPPMPLAVQRMTLEALPATVKLDDSMAMMPDMKLSGFDQWVLTARVSLGGQPQAQSGDLQGSLTVARSALGDSALHLTIDEVVP